MSEKIKIFIIKNRLGIGLLFGIPFMMFGFFTELAILHWDITLVETSVWKFIFASIVSFSLLPYIWMINDYYDAPFDKLDEKKKEKNYFCSSTILENPVKAKMLLLTPIIVSGVASLLISFEVFILAGITIILGHFYSAPPLRFKERIFLDVSTHGFYATGFFFILGGSVFSSITILLEQPLFLLFFILSFIDGMWLQFNSQLIDFDIDKKGSQTTTSIGLGKNASLVLLRMIISGMLIILPLYILFSPTFSENIPNLITLIFFLASFSGVVFYIRKSYQMKEFDEVRKLSAWVRKNFVYPFGVFGILFINLYDIL
ncbi:MAG: UbiA family prenyltransferase [Candidatus Hodarchaeales archaeon]